MGDDLCASRAGARICAASNFPSEQNATRTKRTNTMVSVCCSRGAQCVLRWPKLRMLVTPERSLDCGSSVIAPVIVVDQTDHRGYKPDFLHGDSYCISQTKSLLACLLVAPSRAGDININMSSQQQQPYLIAIISGARTDDRRRPQQQH